MVCRRRDGVPGRDRFERSLRDGRPRPQRLHRSCLGHWRQARSPMARAADLWHCKVHELREHAAKIQFQGVHRVGRREGEGERVSAGWRMANDRWQMTDGGWRMANDRWQMTDGGWRMANDRWQMTDGGWRMANDRWQMTDDRWQMT